jgi:hypothetical protein
MQLTLTGYEGERVLPYVVRIDIEGDGSLRQRVWRGDGPEQPPLLDLRHSPLPRAQGLTH